MLKENMITLSRFGEIWGGIKEIIGKDFNVEVIHGVFLPPPFLNRVKIISH